MREYMREAEGILGCPRPLVEMLAENRQGVLTTLAEFLGDSDMYKRKSAALALGQIGDKSILGALESARDRENVEGVHQGMAAAVNALRTVPEGASAAQRQRAVNNLYAGKPWDWDPDSQAFCPHCEQWHAKSDAFCENTGRRIDDAIRSGAAWKFAARAWGALESRDWPTAANAYNTAYELCDRSNLKDLGLRAEICAFYGFTLINLHDLNSISDAHPPTPSQFKAVQEVGRIWEELLEIWGCVPEDALRLDRAVVEEIRKHWITNLWK